VQCHVPGVEAADRAQADHREADHRPNPYWAGRGFHQPIG
jgi:hypothetical protein